jgi:hypothetical protein
VFSMKVGVLPDVTRFNFSWGSSSNPLAVDWSKYIGTPRNILIPNSLLVRSEVGRSLLRTPQPCFPMCNVISNNYLCLPLTWSLNCFNGLLLH